MTREDSYVLLRRTLSGDVGTRTNWDAQPRRLCHGGWGEGDGQETGNPSRITLVDVIALVAVGTPDDQVVKSQKRLGVLDQDRAAGAASDVEITVTGDGGR